jgi:hypothetical protein
LLWPRSNQLVSFPSSAGSATYITHVTVIDTKFGKEVQDRTVIILGDRIGSKRQQREKATCAREGSGR